MNDQINEFGIVNPEVQKCRHNIKSRNTSIVILDTPRTFTFPQDIYGVCKCCGKPFHFVKDENGKIKKYNEKINKEDN